MTRGQFRRPTCTGERGRLADPGASGLSWVQYVRRLAVCANTANVGTQRLRIETRNNKGDVGRKAD